MREWISVEDRLPEHGHSVLLTNNVLGRTAQGQMSHLWIGFIIKASNPERTGKYISYDNGDRLIMGITHWMPLPDPPKESGQPGASE